MKARGNRLVSPPDTRDFDPAVRVMNLMQSGVGKQ
jgi:hypothetical protein